MIEVERYLDIIRARLGRIVNPTTAQPTHESMPDVGPSPISWLAGQLGLSPNEQAVLWLLVAHELCPRSREMLRGLNTEEVADPTLDAVRRVVYGSSPSVDAWRELAADGRLMRFGLIERTDGAARAPEYRQTLKVARRVLAVVHGDRLTDSELSAIATTRPQTLDLAELELDHTAVERVRAAIRGGARFVVVRGGTGSGRRSMLVALVRETGHDVLVIDGRAISTERDRAEHELRLVGRESTMHGLIPLVQHLDALGPAGDVPDRLDLVERELAAGLFATATMTIARRWTQPPVVIELRPLAGARRAKLWTRAVPEASAADADVLATMYPLAPAMIHAAGSAIAAQRDDGPLRPHHIEAGIRTILDARFAGLATRVDVAQTWDDLVLPDDQLAAIAELLARIRKRRRVYEDWGFGAKLGKGLGVVSLFSGPPGTGKTMCAGLIARELGTELYQLDLSRMVSKWIGETEKNLAAVFDAAEAGHAILLFDEADALFGKRTEVKSSNDRHANREVDYLLQRLETFAGVCILTTNHDSAIDEAFRRRLSTHVRFPLPELDQRRKLWRALLPSSAPTAPELGLDRLAERFVMSGGYIRNAVLRAAFLAADQETPIGAEHLARAAQLEYEAMGKLVAG